MDMLPGTIRRRRITRTILCVEEYCVVEEHKSFQHCWWVPTTTRHGSTNGDGTVEEASGTDLHLSWQNVRIGTTGNIQCRPK